MPPHTMNKPGHIFSKGRVNIIGHSSIKMTEKYTHSDVNSFRNTLSKVSLKKEAKEVKITSRPESFFL
jgi:hypothetical protein